MKPVDPDVYRRALDRIDVMKAALRKIAAGDRLAAVIARDALELVSITDAWDNASLDANGIPVPPSLETACVHCKGTGKIGTEPGNVSYQMFTCPVCLGSTFDRAGKP